MPGVARAGLRFVARSAKRCDPPSDRSSQHERSLLTTLDKADPITKKRLLDLAACYERVGSERASYTNAGDGVAAE